MEIGIGTDGVELSWQADWPTKTECGLCTSEQIGKNIYARLALVVQEAKENQYVCSIRQKTYEIWPHDAIAVALYICPNCGEKALHQRGVPCNSSKCPKCGTAMVRR